MTVQSLKVSLEAPGRLWLDLNEISRSPRISCFPVCISNLETIKNYNIRHFLLKPLRPTRMFWKGPSGVFGMMIMLAKDENLSDGCHSVKKKKKKQMSATPSEWDYLRENNYERILMSCGKYTTVTIKLKWRGIHIYITCRFTYVLPRLLGGRSCEV